MLLPLLPFNLSPQFPIPRIPLQVPVSCRAEGVIHRTLGIPLPVPPGLGVPNGRGTNTDGFFHTLPTVTVGAHPQGNHGVHAGIVLNGQVPADILQIGIIGRCRTYAESPASGTSGLRPSFSQHSAYSWSILLARANALPHSRHLQTGFDFLGKKYSSAISQLTALKTNVRRTAFCHRTLGSVASHDGVFYYNITN